MRATLLMTALSLLAAGPALAGRLEGGTGSNLAFGSGDRNDSGGRLLNATERLDRDAQRFGEIQSKFGLQADAEAAPALQAIEGLITQARQAIANGNGQSALNLCGLLETRLSALGMYGSRKSVDHARAGENGGLDSGRLRQDQRNAAELGIQRVSDRLAYFAQRLESGKNAQAANLVGKVRALLDAARRELAAGRPQNAPFLLAQADPLLNELQRLQQAVSASDQNPGVTVPTRDPSKDQQASAQAALAQADAIYQRVYNSAERLGERPAEAQDPKIAALRARVFDLLEKAKEALANGQPESANGYCLKAESLLAEWHRSLSAPGGKLSQASIERVKAKLDRAADLVAGSGNDKAAKILEKAREHFEKAERGQADGQAARAEVEMDLALKLAAKAVDIARSR